MGVQVPSGHHLPDTNHSGMGRCRRHSLVKPGHLADAVAALDIHLTDEEVQSLQAPYTARAPTYF